MNKNTIFLLMALLSLATPALAHTGVNASHTVMAGFIHPWQGVDHLLVMFAVGLWASIRGGRALWFLPLTFVTLMNVGAMLSFAGVSFAFSEFWVAASVLVFGLIIRFHWQISMALATGLVTAFALFHGYVHAAEITNATEQLSYTLGFLFSTALLHSLGIAAGLLNAKTKDLLRINFGYLCAAPGCLLLVGY
jgi:urease accessory protein